MKKILLINHLRTIISLVEIIISIVIIIGVLAGMYSSLMQLPAMFNLTADRFYAEFSSFLGNILLIVVGIELVRMLVTHTTRATLELVIYVIARKLLIYTETMMDMLLGTIALAIIFFTMRFILLRPAQRQESDRAAQFPGYIQVRDLNKTLGLSIPIDSELTLAEMIKKLAGKNKAPLVNQHFKAGPVNFVVKELGLEGEVLSVEVTDSTMDEEDPYDH